MFISQMACCSYRGPGFIPRTHMMAHNHLYLQFQEIRFYSDLLASGTQAYLQAKQLYNTIKIWKVLQMEREGHALSHVFLGNFTLFFVSPWPQVSSLIGITQVKLGKVICALSGYNPAGNQHIDMKMSGRTDTRHTLGAPYFIAEAETYPWTFSDSCSLSTVQQGLSH